MKDNAMMWLILGALVLATAGALAAGGAAWYHWALWAAGVAGSAAFISRRAAK